MTFELMRMGWPNTAAIVALAMMPIVSLATANNRLANTTQVAQAEPAAVCLKPAAIVFAAIASGDTVLE